MLGQLDHSDDAQVVERVLRLPPLQIELQASERVWGSVRNSLLRWLSDPSVDTFSREVGWPLKISLEEVDSRPGQGAVGTLRLNIIWAPPESVALAQPAAEPLAQEAPLACLPEESQEALLAYPAETLEQTPPQPFVFFADPPIVWRTVHVPLEATSDQAALARADGLRHALSPPRRPIVRAMRKAETRTMRFLSAWALALHAAARTRTLATRRWLTGAWMARSRLVAGVLLLQKRLLRINLRSTWHDAGSRAQIGGAAAAVGIAVLFAVVSLRAPRPAAPSLPVRDAVSPERHAPLSTGAEQVPRVAIDLPQPVPTAQPVASRSDRDDVATGPERASIRPVGKPEKVATIGVYSRVRSDALRPEAPPPALAAFVQPTVKPRTPVDRPAVPLFVGALLVTSEPEGAEVSINGVPQGRTPLTIPGLPAGSRVVRLDLPGYERWSSSVRVVANARTSVAVKLQPEVSAASTSF